MKNPKDSEKDNQRDDSEKDNQRDDSEKDNQKDQENIKNLQRKLSERDLELKKAQDDLKKIEELKKENAPELEKIQKELAQMREELGKVNQTNRREVLAKAYPDILPDLLIGKTDEEISKIVDLQRDMNKKLYGDSHAFIKPEFSSVEDIDKAIEAIKNDKSIRGELAAFKVLDLERKRVKFLS